MDKLIDADKLKRAILKIDDSWFDKGAVIDTIDEQPELKAPFKAVAEIKVDDDKLREICCREDQK